MYNNIKWNLPTWTKETWDYGFLAYNAIPKMVANLQKIKKSWKHRCCGHKCFAHKHTYI